MKQILLALTLIFPISYSIFAQVPKEKTLLWQITGKGFKSPSYLYGTFHLMCPSDLKMPTLVKQKFNTTKQLYLEVDMDDPSMMIDLMKGMQMHDTFTLRNLLPYDYDSLSNIFKTRTGVTLNMVNKTKPFLLMSMIYPSILGCQPVSWEEAFMQMAKEKSMELKALKV